MVATQAAHRDAVMDDEFFSVRLRQLRVAAGLNQGQLAAKAGLKPNTISQLESGRNAPTWATILALADALGVSCDAFREDPAQAPEPPASRRGRPKKRDDEDAK